MTTESNWAPEACTLPTAEQPLRIAEFGALFAESLREVDRLSPRRLRLVLDAAAHAKSARLAAAESSCCSFFTFTFTEPADGRFALDIEVPEAHTDVLNALAAQADGARS